MSWELSSDRRQFGRRESNVKAYAILPGQVSLPCIIENVSDGGALLRFTDGAAPTQSFRLMIEGTEFNILCEIRYTNRRRAGVRFVRLADGIALNRHLHRAITLPQEAGDATACRVRVNFGAPTPSVRALREALCGRWVLVELSDIAEAAGSHAGGGWTFVVTAAAATTVSRAFRRVRWQRSHCLESENDRR